MSCAVFIAALLGAASGDTVTLSTRTTCERVLVRDRDYGAAGVLVVVPASSTIRGLRLVGVKGLTWTGGTLQAFGGLSGWAGDGYAGFVDKSERVSFRGVKFTNALRGLVISESRSVDVWHSDFFGLRSDGINFVASHGGRFIGNRMWDFRPIPKQCFDAAGKVLAININDAACTAAGGVRNVDGDHPDGIQGWGGSTGVEAVGNSVQGNTQAIGYHGLQGSSYGGWDVSGNFIRVSTGWGIRLVDCKGCRAVGNDLGRWQGSTSRVQLNVTGATGLFCGNRNPDASARDATVKPC